MTLPADVYDRRHAGRRGAVIAVTIVAGRRRQVPFARHRLPMDAGFVFFDLVGRDFVRRHVLLIRVTGAASIGDLQWVNRGT